MKELKPTLHFMYTFAAGRIGWLINKIDIILAMRIRHCLYGYIKLMRKAPSGLCCQCVVSPPSGSGNSPFSCPTVPGPTQPVLRWCLRALGP